MLERKHLEFSAIVFLTAVCMFCMFFLLIIYFFDLNVNIGYNKFVIFGFNPKPDH